NFLAGIKRQLGRSFPTETLRHVARQPRAPIAFRFVPKLLDANPDLEPTQALPDDAAWGDIAEADRDAARAEWATFQSEALSFRGLPARTLLQLSMHASGNNPVRGASNRILTSAADFNLESEGVEAFLARQPAALDGLGEDLRAP